MSVAICIPTYDRIDYLREAIRSVSNQTYRGFQILIGDDSARPDYNRQVVEVLAEFPELSFRLIQHPKTLGMLGNANFLIDAADQEYWYYFPDDDRMRPRCLERLVDGLERHPDAGFAFSDHWIIDAAGAIDADATEENTRKYGRAGLRSGPIQHRELVRLALRQAFAIQTMLFRRDVIRRFRFDPEYADILDLDLELRLATSPDGPGAYYCGERLVEYRVHAGQFTAAPDFARRCRQIIASLERCEVIPARDAPLYRRKLAEHYAALALAEHEMGAAEAPSRMLRRALGLTPARPRFWLYWLLLALPAPALPSLRRLRSLLS